MTLYYYSFKITSYIFSFIHDAYILFSKKLNITYKNYKLYDTLEINNDTYNIYNVLIDNCYHKFICINQKMNDNTFEEILDLKCCNIVLNCTINEKDVTNDFQKFGYMLHKWDADIKWKHFFQYVKINHGCIQITLNNDDMTMYHHDIIDITNKKFYLETTKKLY